MQLLLSARDPDYCPDVGRVVRPCLAEDPAGRRTKYFYLDGGGGGPGSGVPPVAAEPEPAPTQTPAGERWRALDTRTHTTLHTTVGAM